ncbi:MAG: hypothetical protein ACD_12C00810G0003 [uncultured bacterium]|nr:MAG: hypothetical protein ACD_12C00810G0003 [uncultured bacterium]
MIKSHSNKKEKAINLIKKLTLQLENTKPSKKAMIEDVKMMSFKIRPLFGDISTLANNQVGFLEVLWKIGKIEEIVTEGIKNLDEEEKKTFFQYLENVQRKMSFYIDSFPPKNQQKMESLELEIFKDKRRNKDFLN